MGCLCGIAVYLVPLATVRMPDSSCYSNLPALEMFADLRRRFGLSVARGSVPPETGNEERSLLTSDSGLGLLRNLAKKGCLYNAIQRR